VGLTYYTMDNFLFSSSIGVGGFTLVNEREDIDVSTDPGFSFQLKVGKEWWVSPKWAFGVSAYYLSTNSLNLKGDVAEERIISSNLGILISATLNGRR